MELSSYQSIIETKITEWQSKLEKLEERTRKAGSREQESFRALFERISSAVDSATLQLRELDKQETAKNTLEIKDKILKIFESIDQELVNQEEKTPYML